MTQTQGTVVSVIGSGRSGTSAVAHLVRELGVFFGPKAQLRLETAWNADGCWEHEQLMNVNLHLFRRLGGTDVVLPAFPRGWQLAPELEDLRTEAQRLIRRDFEGRALWGWKDPTVCLTLPFWQEIVGEMRYVICVRNPVDVIASLEKQWGWSLPSAINSWIERNLSSVLYTTGQQRLFFSFDDYFQHPEEHIERLARFLGQPLPAEGTATHDRIFKTVRGELRNFASPLEKVLMDERLTDGDKDFYRVLLEACRAPESQADPDLLALLEAYRGASRGRYQQLHGYFQAYATQTESELDAARRAATSAQAKLDKLARQRIQLSEAPSAGVSAR